MRHAVDPMCAESPQSESRDAATATTGGGAPAFVSGWRAAGGIALLTIAAYLPALRGEFVVNEDIVVRDNPRLTADDGLRRIWFAAETDQYQPLMYTSLWLERRIWGLNVWGYRLVNVVLHVANALLIWILLKRIGVRAAVVAAALFALHPVNVESVAWIYERKNVLSGVFYFAAFWAALDFEERGNRRSYGLALVLFAAALLTKASTVVLPAVLLLYWWWRRTLGRRRNIAMVVPLFVMGAAMAAVTLWYEHRFTGTGELELSVSLAERFARAGWLVAFFAGKAVIPYGLAFFYPRWSANPASAWSYLPHAVMLIALILLLMKRNNWGRPVLFGLGVYVVSLFPVLGFFDIYYQQYSPVADHFQYLAIVAPIALCVHGVATLLERLRFAATGTLAERTSSLGRVLTVLAIVGFWYLTSQRAQLYQSTRFLCEDTLRKYPNSWLAHYKLGEYLLRGSGGNRDVLTGALHHFDEAMEIRPDEGDALANRGITLQLLDRDDEAMTSLRRAVDAEPDNPLFRLNLGGLLEKRGQIADAIAEYREAAQNRPDLAVAQMRLGNALARDGRLDEAVEYLQKAVVLQPDSAENQFALGAALCQSGRLDEGIGHLREAYRVNPKDLRITTMLERAERQRRSPSTAPAGGIP